MEARGNLQGSKQKNKHNLKTLYENHGSKKQITDAASQYDICRENKCCRAPNGKKA